MDEINNGTTPGSNDTAATSRRPATFVNALEQDTSGDKSRSPKEQLAFERRREREFYRYYEPFQSLSQRSQSKCDLNDEQSVRNHQAQSSPDKALTAFTQLAALRIGTRRAMLFFFDADYAYILAEATRSLSLQDDSRHDINDELWLGHTRIPRGFSVCEHTVNLCPPNAGEVHVIPNLSEDTRFCNRPYVTDGPKARFYAGVPITTPRGINIGAFCVLDDRPRSGLSDTETVFLQEMSTTVMTHLEMVRAKSVNQRSRDMNIGMSAFMDGHGSVEEWLAAKQRLEGRLRDDNVNGDTVSVPVTPGETPGDNPGEERQGFFSDAALRDSNKSGPASQKKTKRKRPKHIRNDTARSATNEVTHTSGERSESDRLAQGIPGAYTRAAKILQAAMGADGVHVLDASVESFGGLVDAATGNGKYPLSGDESFQMSSAPESDFHQPAPNRAARSPLKHCKVLGKSHSARQQDMLDEIEQNEGMCTEKFLAFLLRRYPHGKVWNFSAEGDVSSDSLSEREAGAATRGKLSRERERTLRRKDISAREHKRLQAMFPAARSLVFLGMWDSHRGKWAAASFVWCNSSIKLFSNDPELNYLAAFGDVIMAEVSRLNALAADQAKTDFLSSISHELRSVQNLRVAMAWLQSLTLIHRSPLHGILGNVETLQEQVQDLDFTSWETIRSIESCGNSLLDVINHLLEYTRVNERGAPHKPSLSNGLEANGSKPPNRPANDVNQTPYTGTALDELLEEVLETAVAGTQQSKHSMRDYYAYGDGSTSSPPTPGTKQVDFGLEISDAPSWYLKIDTAIARQIAMNLVSNAVKYTESGSIFVRIRSEPTHAEDANQRRIVLSVTDTGIGMSTSFVEERLFHAFQQENSLSPGTGLGLNLVANMVKSLGGNIAVSSNKGEGTEITVTLTLDAVPAPGPVSEDKKKYGGHKIGLISWPSGLNPDEHSSTDQRVRQELLSSLGYNMRALGLVSCSSERAFPPDASLFAVLEEDFETLRSPTSDGDIPLRALRDGFTSKSLIVLCRSIRSARQLKASSRIEENGYNLIFAAQPVGPIKLSRLLDICLGSNAASRTPSASLEPHNPPFSPSVSFPTTLSAPATEDLSEADVMRPLGQQELFLDTRAGAGASPEIQDDTAASLLAKPSIHLAERPKPPSRSKADAETQPQPLRRQSESISSVETSLPLLLVDDNPVNLRILTMYAKRSAHTYSAAVNGQEAVDIYEGAVLPSAQQDSPATVSTKPRVVLMDINMPVLDGFAATRAIRALERKTGVQPATIIALTGLGGAEDRREAFASGVDLFLTKPVKLKELHRILDGVAERDREGHGEGDVRL
ncbi:hypothetical protein MBLNU230_g5165t1 [Neophaeotheca triangularis]